MADYASPGYLLFVRDEALIAQPFDVNRMEFTGEPVSVSQSVASSINGRVGVAVSRNGVIAFRETSSSQGGEQLIWFDRTGKQTAELAKPGSYRHHALSPNGKQLAVSIFDGRSVDIWIMDLVRGISSRFTSDPNAEINPVWSSAGDSIVFSSNRAKGIASLYLKAATGFGEERLLFASEQNVHASDWSADGRFVFYQSGVGNTRGQLYALPVMGDPKPVPVQMTSFDEFDARLSPDGRWLAFVSNASGPYQVHVRSFPGEERKWQISSQGGLEPRWRGDGKELFFRSLDDTLMAVQTNFAGGIDPGVPSALFQPDIPANLTETRYAVTANGQRFLVNVTGNAQTTTPITIVVNWPAILKR